MRFILLLFITLFISFITSSDSSSSSSSLPHPDIHPDTTSHHPDIHLRIGTFHLNDALLTSHHTLSTTSSSHPIKIGNLQLELHTPWHIQQQISQRHVMSVEDEVATDQEQAEEPDLWFLTLKAPILASTLDHIKRILSPSTLGTYVPYNTYIIHAPLSHVIRLTPESIPGLLYIHRMHPVCKIDPDLKERLLTYLTRRHELSQDITSLNATQHAHLRVTWAYDATSPTLSHLLHEWHDLWQQQHQHHLLSYHYHIVDGSQLRITVPHEDIMKMSDISILLQKLYDTRTPTSTPSTSIDTLLSHLLSHPSLTWIESDNLFTIHNKFSRYVVQSDLPETDPTAATMYLHGIHGENEIIAVGDTGVDHDNCYFHDPKVVTPVNIVDTLHRKIITYVTSPMNGGTGPLGPDGDEVGHGSHTAGTLVGSVMDNGRGMNPDLKTLALYNGIANASKLAIYDFQNPGEDSLYLPNLIYEDYFKPANDIGARICSNSWGDDSGDYDSYTRDVDRFMVDYPDFLAVFAAGNAGTSGVNGLTSLSTPAVAKNVLTVGSSYNSEASWAELGYNAGVTIAEPKAVSGTFFVATADYGPSYSVQQKTSAEAIMANPENACSDLTNDVDVRGKVVIVRRGICSFVTKSNNVQKAGGIMMLLITNTAEAPVIMYPGTTPPDSITATTITIPSIMIGQNDGEKLIPYINTLKIHFPSTAGKDLNEMRMSDFSSRGPTKDGRLKPDLITPGEHIQSAKSDKDVHTYQCQNKQTNVEIMEGTSMATPLAAASATLVRQYLREGHYYNHATKSIDVYTSPSSALLKAILIQSAQPIGGSVMGSKKDVAEKFDVTPVPSYFQGHGRVQLNTVVTFDENDQFHTILQDKQSIEQNQVQRTCVKMKSAPLNFTLRATLVWTDPAGMPASAMLLVNNLDLSIDGPMKNDTGSFNTAWLGNNNVDDVTLPPAKRSNGPQQQWDTSNNVEKIIIPTRQLMSDGTYAIGVRGTSIPTARQFYALVITGEFDVVDCPLEHYCPNNCFNHGICDESHCICDYHYAGADCSQSTIAISGSGTPIELTSATNQWVYYHYDTDGYETSLTWRMQSDGKGDPDFYLLFNGYPTLSNFTASNTDCDTCGKTDHTMIVPNETLTKFGAGTWTLGVWGYCCRDTWVKLWLEIQSRPRPATEAPTTKVPTTEAPTTLPPVVSSTAESSTGTSSTGSSGGDASSSPSPSTSTSTSSSTGPYYNISSQAYRFHLTFTTDINITHVIPSLCTIISFSCTRLLRSGYGDRDIYLTLLPPSPSNNSIFEKNEMNNDMIITKIQTMYTDIQKQPSPFNMLDISQPLIPQTYTVYWCPPWGITCTESSGTEPIINTTPTSDKPEVTWFGLNRNFLIAVVVGISVLCLTVMCCVCIHRKRRVEASGGAHHRVVTSQAPKVITTRTSRAASSPKKQHLPPVAMISSNPQDDTVLSDGEDVDDQQTFVVGGGGGGGEDELMSESDLEGAHAQPHPHIGTAEIQIGVDSERE